MYMHYISINYFIDYIVFFIFYVFLTPGAPLVFQKKTPAKNVRKNTQFFKNAPIEKRNRATPKNLFSALESKLNKKVKSAEIQRYDGLL